MGNLPIPFDNPRTYDGHSGVDFPKPRGTQFRASAPGVVGLRSQNPRGGKMVWIDYDGYPGVAYAHLDDYTDSPPVGTRVKEGDVIGRIGMTGNTDGPHLHVEVDGYPTTPGFWRFFDPNRVVGGGGGGGGEGPADIAAGQRTAGPAGARRRSEPSSQSPEAGEALVPGTVGNFNGWIRGENVEGNNVWYRGISGNWFWSGGFVEGANGTGLTDLNPTTPPPVGAGQRVTIAASNGRSAPSTTAEIRQTLPAGTVGDFNGWIRGENVEGNNAWIRGAHSGDWFWLGAFEPRNVDGLADLNSTTPPVDPPETNPDNPRGLPTYTPIYPGAAFGLVAPLGDGKRGVKGSGSSAVTVPVIIDRYIVHHTGTTADQLDYFSWKNGGDSCPTWYLRTSGQVIELIRPGMKPAATGAEWNWRSVAVETLNETGSPEWRVTDAQLEAHAQMIAWLASYNGKALDGAPVSFTMDREHVISDRETRATICPGPYLQGKLDSIIARAKVIYAEKYEPTDPDTIPVDRSVLEKLYEWLKGVLGR